MPQAGSGTLRDAFNQFGIPSRIDPSQAVDRLTAHPLGYEGDDARKRLEPMTKRERYLYANGGYKAVQEERGFVHREMHNRQHVRAESQMSYEEIRDPNYKRPYCAICAHWKTNGPPIIEEAQVDETAQTAAMVQATAPERGQARPENQPQGTTTGEQEQAPKVVLYVPLSRVRLEGNEGRKAAAQTRKAAKERSRRAGAVNKGGRPVGSKDTYRRTRRKRNG